MVNNGMLMGFTLQMNSSTLPERGWKKFGSTRFLGDWNRVELLIYQIVTNFVLWFYLSGVWRVWNWAKQFFDLTKW